MTPTRCPAVSVMPSIVCRPVKAMFVVANAATEPLTTSPCASACATAYVHASLGFVGAARLVSLWPPID